MLVLSRRKNESVVLRNRLTNQVLCEVYVVEIRGDKVRVGFNAPDVVSVHRQEVDAAVQVSGVDKKAGNRVIRRIEGES